MKRLLWVGDAGVESGFAKVTHNILDHLVDEYHVSVIGINYRGDPHSYPYPIYPAWIGGDIFGVKRLEELHKSIKPDLVILQNDPWNIATYTKTVPGLNYVGNLAVDGLNCRGKLLNDLSLGVFWNDFGLRQARAGGYIKPAAVIPLGVDLLTFRAIPRHDARVAIGLGSLQDAFIVGNVNRNQPRKRLDLTIEAFAKWIKRYNIDNGYLFLHVAPTGDQGYDCQQLADYYGVGDRLILSEPTIWKGYSEERMAHIYNCFDVQVNTAQGEGWGLTTMEGMACGVPQVVPAWAALEEWATPAAIQIECPTTCVTPTFINSIGGVIDVDALAQVLHTLYESPSTREMMKDRGLSLVQHSQYRWEHIANRWSAVLAGKEEAIVA